MDPRIPKISVPHPEWRFMLNIGDVQGVDTYFNKDDPTLLKVEVGDIGYTISQK